MTREVNHNALRSGMTCGSCRCILVLYYYTGLARVDGLSLSCGACQSPPRLASSAFRRQI